ncbi:GNAT family N-acetyltransferase [Haloglycomyces albus]|uniref:GNAT family N-acetyltransferase n=1 Tax=Haloglycomyces albus TaxID=526067 RepID=UPI001B7FA81C|nr:GNAT family N-acetyltransferase [Haloglycomyces albus]
MIDYDVRLYRRADEADWLRCRLLSFFTSSYYDDVRTTKPTGVDIELVAVGDDGVVGLIDVSVAGREATIEDLAVHPDHRRRGIAEALLDDALARLESTELLQAWTRRGDASNAWYEAAGFTVEFEYLHVYIEHDESGLPPAPPLAPVTTFAHASVEAEQELRARYRRVYRCRQYVKDLETTRDARTDIPPRGNVT